MFSDIDECLKPGACGSNAICLNSVGNHTCQCLEGFSGNPYDGVIKPFYFIFFTKNWIIEKVTLKNNALLICFNLVIACDASDFKP